MALESHRRVLDSTLFLLLINYLPTHVNCNVILFADDCLLYRDVNNQSDSELLQKDLTNLENREKTWQMKFNPEKCYVIHVTKKKIPLKFDYLLHNHILQPVDNSKYLGVTISNDLDWGPHINNITTKVNKILSFLRINMKNCTQLKTLRTHHLFVRLSNTLHQFGIHLNNSKYHQVEQMQRKAARYVFNDYRDRSPGTVTN